MKKPLVNFLISIFGCKSQYRVKYHGMSFERLNHVLHILQERQGVSQFAGIECEFIASSSLSNQYVAMHMIQEKINK
jgi:hypothetical protein